MKVAIYCRLSEEDKDKANHLDDSASIQNQKTMLIQYATSQQWDIYQIYSDDDYTGADRNRPQFQKLLEDAQTQKFQVILCKTQSRFTRELELVEKYIHDLFPSLGIRFVSIVDNADTHNKGNKKSRQINGLVNQWYLEDMSENIRSVLTSRRQMGLHIGSFALYGYKKDPDNKGKLLLDPPAAQIVQEVFTLYQQGLGKTAIAKHLNQKGIPNPTQYKREQGLRYQQAQQNHSTLWKYYTISSMLQNEMYCGHMIQGKYGSISYKTKENKPRPKDQWYKVEHTHPAIISPSLWNAVQNLLASHTKPYITGEIGLFSGKTTCIHCGYTLRSTKNRNRHYLQCPTHHFAKDHCSGAFIPVSQLEDICKKQMQQIFQNHLEQETFSKAFHQHFQNPRQTRELQLQEEQQQYQRNYDETKKHLHTLYHDKLKGIITEEDYLHYQKEFHRTLGQIQQSLTESEEKRQALPPETNPSQALHDFYQVKHLPRSLLDQLIHHIAIGRRIPQSHDIPVEIHWRF